ncbi:sugar phosphate isomerase/epimerase family protein [Clostridium manihotivorum]|uniref:Sugar phosphate isomerase/epimerase n=1 Tax=Clostridium manihotivorum TaxID=2320868 RepID=A0A3R5UAG7_9CLOT|nr:sugar phosphate isomerase/epimerase [Clostridium manihotivorum]QAA33600.1 sugar phosphate isomerase/epimerase [Clostridium manihotivorum]
MVEIGCLARFNNPYEEEVEFALKNNFKIMQVWYDKDGIRNYEQEENRLNKIISYGFPTIIHAVLDINEMEEHAVKLIGILNKLKHKELIIHPVCHSENIEEATIYKLSDVIGRVLGLLKPNGITLYLENNSKIDPIFSTSKEIEIMFANNPDLEFLLDIAHIYSYEHLKEMVSIKMPKILHITDKYFNIIHEHLPLGQGEIDFKYIFDEILYNYDGKIILEITKEDEDIIRSKEIVEELLRYNQ